MIQWKVWQIPHCKRWDLWVDPEPTEGARVFWNPMWVLYLQRVQLTYYVHTYQDGLTYVQTTQDIRPPYKVHCGWEIVCFPITRSVQRQKAEKGPLSCRGEPAQRPLPTSRVFEQPAWIGKNPISKVTWAMWVETYSQPLSEGKPYSKKALQGPRGRLAGWRIHRHLSGRAQRKSHSVSGQKAIWGSHHVKL